MGPNPCSLAIGLHPRLADADRVAAQLAEHRIVHAMDHTLELDAGPGTGAKVRSACADLETAEHRRWCEILDHTRRPGESAD